MKTITLSTVARRLFRLAKRIDDDCGVDQEALMSELRELARHCDRLAREDKFRSSISDIQFVPTYTLSEVEDWIESMGGRERMGIR